MPPPGAAWNGRQVRHVHPVSVPATRVKGKLSA